MFDKLDAAGSRCCGSTLYEKVESCSPTIDERIGFFGTVFHRIFFSSQKQKASSNLNGRSFSLLKFLTFAGLLFSVRGQQSETPNSQLQLSSLDGTNGLFLNGAQVGDLSGNSVSYAGDVNGDGISDFIIGAPEASPSGMIQAGQTYIVFGKKGLGAQGAIHLSNLNRTNGMLLTGALGGDISGHVVSDAGDVNGDGISDFLIGAPYADPAGKVEAGKTYVVFGSPLFGMVSRISISILNGAKGFALHGEQVRELSGLSVSNAGDVNGDGMTDIIIGAPGSDSPGLSNAGRAYVIFGSRNLGVNGTMLLSSLNGTNGFVINGRNIDDYFGYSVSNAGDVNGDNIDDIIIGAPYADPTGLTDAGKSYVIFGGVNLGIFGTFDLSSLDGSNGFVIHGEKAADNSGYAVSNAGDVNGDGYADLLIGAPKASSSGRSNAGKSYLIFGSKSKVNNGIFKLSTLNGSFGFTLNGMSANEQSGTSVAHAGDLNGDGIDDFLIGAPQASLSSSRLLAGRAYVIFGSRTLGTTGRVELSSLDGSNGYSLNGEQAGDQSGTSVACAGDVNGDGIDDVIIGAPMSSRSTMKAGATYLIFGKKISQASSLTKTANQLTTISQLSTATQTLLFSSLKETVSTKGAKSGTLSDTDILLSIISRTSNFQVFPATPYTTQKIRPSIESTGMEPTTLTTNIHTMFVSERIVSDSSPIYIGIALSVVALCLSVIAGGYFYRKRRGTVGGNNEGKQLDKGDSLEGYVSIESVQRGMQSARAYDALSPNQAGGEYDIIQVNNPPGHYNKWPSKPAPHAVDQYTKIEKVEKKHDEYEAAKFKKVHEHYDDVNLE